jgi:uncharacterized protein (TIGR03790 family)
LTRPTWPSQISARCAQLLIIIGMFSAFVLSPGTGALALEPGEVLVVVNTAVPAGGKLAAHYMKQRGVPEENIVRVSVPDDETISRRQYDEKIAAPVRRALTEREPRRRIRCLLLLYGMPLRVTAPEIGPDDQRQIAALERRREETRRRIEALPAGAKEEKERLTRDVTAVDADIARAQKSDQSASVDSEIALAAAGDYPLAGWLPNPFFLGNRKETSGIDKSRVLMVSRLDGPDEKSVRRIIDDSLAAEKQGLSGTAYFDARWPEPAGAPKGGYEFYDASIHRAARRVAESGRMPVKVDSTERLFQPGDCPDAALYCGWYSLAEYVDAFTWKPGAVAYHIASSECVTLKQKGSRVWCKRMLEEGAAAVIGPVEEPYVEAFPVPEIFFALLVDGYLSLAECYAASTPWLSWRMVLIGDPLYRPFAGAKPIARQGADQRLVAFTQPIAPVLDEFLPK